MSSAQDHFNAANELFVEEEFAAAGVEYDKAIALDASKASFFVARASNNLKLKKFIDAVADSTKAKKLDDKNSKASMKLGSASTHLLKTNKLFCFHHFAISLSHCKDCIFLFG